MIKYWKSIAIAIIILIGSLSSGDTISEINFLNIKHIDKLVHFLFYFSLSITLVSSLFKHSKLNTNIIFSITIFVSVSYGILMEILQYYIAVHRSAEIFDFISNTIGCITGIMLFNYLKNSKIIKYL